MSNNNKQKKIAPRESVAMSDLEDIGNFATACGPGTKESMQRLAGGSTGCGSCALKDSCGSQKNGDTKSTKSKVASSQKHEANQKPGTAENGKVKLGTLADWPESDEPFLRGSDEC